MIDAAELRSEAVPRGDALCRRGVAWMESRRKIVLFAIGYAWLATMPAGAIIGVAVAAGLPFVDKPLLPPWYVDTIMIAALVAYAAAWIPFVRRIKRRRATARTLFERGAVLDAPLVSSQRVRGPKGGQWQHGTFAFERDGRRHSIVISRSLVHGGDPFDEGETSTVLYEPSVPYCVMYEDGRRPRRRRLG